MEQKIRFHIDGMTCQACASRIEKVLHKKAAVLEAGVNFAGEEAQVRFDPAQTDAATIAAWIDKAGFKAVPRADSAVGCARGYLDFRFAELDWRARHANLARLLDDKLMLRPSFVDTRPA